MRWRFALIAVTPLLLGAWSHGVFNSGSAPVVSVSSFIVASPVSNGGVVGTVSATNTPTSWSITAGNAAGNYSISNAGAITTTASGVTNITGNQFTSSLTVQATNANGSGANTITVNAYADGSVAAPAGSAQHATLLSGYSATPPWKVAGKDFSVGYPSGQVFKDPSGTLPSGCAANTTSGLITCTGVNNGTLDGYDFSCTLIVCSVVPAAGGYGLEFTSATGWTIKNSNFLQNCNGGIGMIHSESSAAGLTVLTSVIDGGGSRSLTCANAAPSGLLQIGGSNITVEWNWMKNAAGHFVETQGGSIVVKWNLMEDGAWAGPPGPGSHLNYLQMFTNTAVNPVQFDFNTIVQHILPTFPSSGGEGPQFGTNTGNTVTNGEAFGNTILALTTCNQGSFGTGCNSGNSCGATICSFSAMVHAASGGNAGQSSITVSNNYLDPRGALDAFYNDTNVIPSGLSLTSYSGNIRMDTGGACNTTGGSPC